MAYFALTSEQGPSWADSKPMRDQEKWTQHAEFINAAMYAGFIILGGPLGTKHPHRALRMINSDSESAVWTWTKEDPWVRAGILRILTIEPWKILVSNDKLDSVLADIEKPDSSSRPSAL